MQPELRKCFPVITAILLTIFFWVTAQADIGDSSRSAENNIGDVASVNGAVISRAQFENAMGYQTEIAALRGVEITDDVMPELKSQVLENLINQELLYQESQRFGIKIDEEAVDSTYEANKEKGNFGTDADFEAALKESNKTLASYRAEIEKGMAIDQFIQTQFTDKTVIQDSEAKAYYDENPGYFKQAEQVRVSHIMLRVDSNAETSQKEKVRKQIEDVKKRIDAGEDFSALANSLSEDTSSKGNGGDIGYIYKGQTPQSFEDVAFSLEKGGVSDVVETDAGYHLVKLTDRKEARTIGFEEAKSDIVSNLQTSKVNSLVEIYVTVLKNRATITTYPISQ
jgi:peptidyl-prolyl cis-trans isomerase C